VTLLSMPDTNPRLHQNLIKVVPLALLGRVFQILGLILYALGAAISIVIVASVAKVDVALGFVLVLAGVLAYGVLRAGHSVFLYGKRLTAKVSAEVGGPFIK
jgi:hypothetical protein